MSTIIVINHIGNLRIGKYFCLLNLYKKIKVVICLKNQNLLSKNINIVSISYYIQAKHFLDFKKYLAQQLICL